MQVTEGPRFAVGDTIALDRTGPNRDTAKITVITANQYTIDTALTNAHAFNEDVTPDDNTATRQVNWLAATVRHEIAHAVETAMGGVTPFTQGLGGWWTSETDFDSWAAAMGSPWTTNDGSVISTADKALIKTAIQAAVANRSANLFTSVAAGHPIKTHWAKALPVITAADACLQNADSFYQSPGSIYAANGKRFSISWWYKSFMYHNESVLAQRVNNYTLYAPAEFFAETYTVFYEEAGRPGITDADHGRLVRNGAWRSWIRNNVHNRGQAPAGTGAAGPAEGATPSGASYGKAANNPGP